MMGVLRGEISSSQNQISEGKPAVGLNFGANEMRCTWYFPSPWTKKRWDGSVARSRGSFPPESFGFGRTGWPVPHPPAYTPLGWD
jgi:hypothetical protein